ncbi:MAG: TVP38/TMEM64 family protein [Cumulibacter sp.]
MKFAHLRDVALRRIRAVPRRAWWHLGVFAGCFAVAGVCVLVFGLPSGAEIRDGVAQWGLWGPVFFVLVFSLVTVGPFPKSILSMAAGALWGVAGGVLICMCAGALGATYSFFLGRYVIGRSVRPLVGPHMREVDEAVDRNFLAVLGIRLLPVLPFTLLNYAFGVTRIRYTFFAVATLLGSIPATTAYVLVGASGGDVTSWQFWVALGAIGMLSVIALIMTAVRRGRNRAPEAVLTHAGGTELN